jgi:hypothetical protein
MSLVELNRRQFMQWGAAAGWMAKQGYPSWAQATGSGRKAWPLMQTDPFLQLALMHEFADHALQAWPLGMRMCVVLDRINRPELVQKLGADVDIQTLFHDQRSTWATLSMNKEALLRLQGQGLGRCFQSHLWGAPWGHSEHRVVSRSMGSTQAEPVSSHQPASPSHLPLARQRVLVIDHGFPLTHLRESGWAYLHHASHANNRPAALKPAYSHGAQTLGLLLQSKPIDLGHAHSPLLLYELPDALLGSMPLGALWPDILDAVHWGVHRVNPGEELIILLSVVSSDGHRHAQSFVTLSAQALQRHAQGLGVDLKWVMAAGNQHQAQQHLRYQVLPGQEAIWQWELPVNNEQASFLECWHDASAGVPVVMFKPPGGTWHSAEHGVTSASRLNPNGKVQTVFRLPSTCATPIHPTQAVAGGWGVRWQGLGGAADLEVHLSMMSSHRAGPFRQAKLLHDPGSTASPRPIQSLSGLVPHMPGVWVAQALGQTEADPLISNPKPDQLSVYSGRWPADHDANGVQCAGAKVDPSSVSSGLHVMSLNGHPIHRSSGTSMAVPWVASGLMSGLLG